MADWQKICDLVKAGKIDEANVKANEMLFPKE
jgi:hypothetical protein